MRIRLTTLFLEPTGGKNRLDPHGAQEGEEVLTMCYYVQRQAAGASLKTGQRRPAEPPIYNRIRFLQISVTSTGRDHRPGFLKPFSYQKPGIAPVQMVDHKRVTAEFHVKDSPQLEAGDQGILGFSTPSKLQWLFLVDGTFRLLSQTDSTSGSILLPKAPSLATTRDASRPSGVSLLCHLTAMMCLRSSQNMIKSCCKFTNQNMKVIKLNVIYAHWFKMKMKFGITLAIQYRRGVRYGRRRFDESPNEGAADDRFSPFAESSRCSESNRVHLEDSQVEKLSVLSICSKQFVKNGATPIDVGNNPFIRSTTSTEIDVSPSVSLVRVKVRKRVHCTKTPFFGRSARIRIAPRVSKFSMARRIFSKSFCPQRERKLKIITLPVASMVPSINDHLYCGWLNMNHQLTIINRLPTIKPQLSTIIDSDYLQKIPVKLAGGTAAGRSIRLVSLSLELRTRKYSPFCRPIGRVYQPINCWKIEGAPNPV
ncbi:unnamed protein product [Nesidiocoris tenuis]|uniref:Uncharacterized protein n=1 Tax=Nesidiocoris tenuis TaxID=355587 RepID=A0A6H5GJY1_9HEMI|nr:unnamed protein product [Nesidiocoris tenuis]